MKVLLIFLLFSSNVITSKMTIKPKDFCFKPTHCEAEECISFKCHGKISYECKGFCAADIYSCQSIRLWSTSLVTAENFEKFAQSIPNCPKYQWKSQGVCHNKNMCLEVSNMPHRMASKGKHILKAIRCECTGKYSYKCANNNYCAVNKRSCNGFKKVNFTANHTKIKECQIKKKIAHNSMYGQLVSLVSSIKEKINSLSSI